MRKYVILRLKKIVSHNKKLSAARAYKWIYIEIITSLVFWSLDGFLLQNVRRRNSHGELIWCTHQALTAIWARSKLPTPATRHLLRCFFSCIKSHSHHAIITGSDHSCLHSAKAKLSQQSGAIQRSSNINWKPFCPKASAFCSLSLSFNIVAFNENHRQ